MGEQAELAAQVGDLLMRSGIVSLELLQDCVTLCERTGEQLGRVVEMNGYTQAASIDAALALKKKIDEKEISLEEAVRIMEMVGRQNIDLETALRLNRSGAAAAIDKSASKLGQLMLNSGVISGVHLAKGLLDSLNTGLPLGMVLVETNIVKPAVLEWCLMAQSMVNSEDLTDEQAEYALRIARLNGWDFVKSLRNYGYPGKIPERKFGLGELLVLAHALTETQLLAAREISLVQGTPVEAVLAECGLVSDKIITAAEQLVVLIDDGAIFEDQAAIIVRKLCQCSTVEQMMAILGNLQAQMTAATEKVEVLDLIGMARIISPEQLIDALAQSKKTNTSLIQTMVDMNMFSMDVITAANQCKIVLESGALELEQGLMALTYAAENQVSLSAALDQFGWCRQLVTA